MNQVQGEVSRSMAASAMELCLLLLEEVVWVAHGLERGRGQGAREAAWLLRRLFNRVSPRAYLKLEVVVGGVFEEHGLLLARTALEANVWLDDELLKGGTGR